jgi:NAD(P)-dependent dehydrogenase (short-subunit alcohol dehydrogenase family)
VGPGEILNSVQGQVIFITGNTGIAEATARLAVARGAQVFVCGLEAEPGDLLHMELGCGHYAGDLTETEHAEKAVAHCLKMYGHIDGLFNVAGASGRKHGDGPLHLLSEHGWEWTLAANLRTTFLVSRTVLRRMIPRRAGSIVNMASILASSPEAGDFATHAYAAGEGRRCGAHALDGRDLRRAQHPRERDRAGAGPHAHEPPRAGKSTRSSKE